MSQPIKAGWQSWFSDLPKKKKQHKVTREKVEFLLAVKFLCRLRSIATHRDYFVRRPSVRLSVRLSVCPSVTLA